jgi:hypothetical protein
VFSSAFIRWDERHVKRKNAIPRCTYPRPPETPIAEKINAVKQKPSSILQKGSGEKVDERRFEVRLVSKKRDKRRLGRPRGYIEKVFGNCKP